MSDVKFSLRWALIGPVVVLLVFGVNYWIADGTLPGYKVLAYPGIISTRLFSEEIGFWPKLGIMLLGQYFIYMVVILIAKKLVRLVQAF